MVVKLKNTYKMVWIFESVDEIFEEWPFKWKPLGISAVTLFIMQCKVVLNLNCSVDKIWVICKHSRKWMLLFIMMHLPGYVRNPPSLTIEMKANEQYVPVVRLLIVNAPSLAPLNLRMKS